MCVEASTHQTTTRKGGEGTITQHIALPHLSHTTIPQISEVDVDFSGKMEFDEFRHMVKKRHAEKDSREEIALAFGVFAGKTEEGGLKEYISAKDLATVALSINEHVDMNKFQDLLNSAPGMPIGTDDEGNSKGLTIVQWREMMAEVCKRSKYCIFATVKAERFSPDIALSIS